MRGIKVPSIVAASAGLIPVIVYVDVNVDDDNMMHMKGKHTGLVSVADLELVPLASENGHLT